MANVDDERDVQVFKNFLRINTMHPNPNLGACVEWVKAQAAELGMTVRVHEFHPGMPVVVTTKQGTDPTLPSVVLNCHMDVVPVVPEKWDKLPAGETPFSAWEDPEGRIYARGSQDMKCVGAQYLCALRRLGGKDATFLRTVHTLWVPDEEIGGPLGMQEFVRSPIFREMNIGVAIDEGLAHNENTFVVFYGERSPLWIVFKAEGAVGHAAKLPPDTATDRLARVVERMTRRRDVSVAKLKENPDLKPGDVSSFNWTMAKHGTTNDNGATYAYNVIPSQGAVAFDCRVCADEYDAFMNEVTAMAEELRLTIEWPGGRPIGASALTNLNSSWYRAMEGSLSKWGAKVQPAIFPAGTDSDFLRKVGVPAFGFSPMRNMESLLHDHNEFLSRGTYLEGVKVYMDLIPSLANLPASGESKL